MWPFGKKKQRKLNNLVRRPWKRKYDCKPTWVGVIELSWYDAKDPSKTESKVTQVTLFESFKDGRYVTYSIEDDRFSTYPMKAHRVYHYYIVPWLNGFDIDSKYFITRNPNHKSILEKKKPELNVVKVDFNKN